VAAVELEGLTKAFGSFVAVDDVSLSIAEGEIFGFLGANGAGKSTTIRMLCGLLKPSSGTGRVLGIDVGADPEGVKRSIGYMSQRFSLYDDLTVAQNLRFFGGVYGLRGAQMAQREAWALSMADLEGRAHCRTRDLPGGWKQRLALACAVLHEPRVVFLDEPTSGVDPISRRRFWRLIDDMAEAGVTVFVTTHYLDEAEHCHRLALLDGGRLVALGTVMQLKQVFRGLAVLEVSGVDVAIALDQLASQTWVRETSVFGTRVHIVVEDAERDRERALELLMRQPGAGAGQTPRIAPVVPSLEDVFIHHVSEASVVGESN
jgi:ABC-2 type transport system ATP-binding protein